MSDVYDYDWFAANRDDHPVEFMQQLRAIRAALEKLAGEKKPDSGGEWEEQISDRILTALHVESKGCESVRRELLAVIRACPPPAGVPVVDVGVFIRELYDRDVGLVYGTNGGPNRRDAIRAALNACGVETK